jgi:hypothetical protein
MQAELFRGKCCGVLEREGLGRLTWPKMVAFADFLIGIVCTDLTLAEQGEIFLLYTSDPLTQPAADDAIDAWEQPAEPRIPAPD